MSKQELLAELAKWYDVTVRTAYHAQIPTARGAHNIYFTTKGRIKFQPCGADFTHEVTEEELLAEVSELHDRAALDREPLLVLDFGKHAGKTLAEVPGGYLRWMLNEVDFKQHWQALARAEFSRRGLSLPKLELSGHAIDNASLRVRKIWHETAVDENEGLYSWLFRVTQEAIANGEQLSSGKIRYLRMKFVVHRGAEFPVLKSIMR